MCINEKNYKFWDGGMVANPILPKKGFNLVCSFKKEKTNLNSRYVDAWKKPEEHAEFSHKAIYRKHGNIWNTGRHSLSK